MTQAVKLREKLVNKLSDLFQLNQPDLDFGFYRIMHAKAAQVQQFIDQDLLTIISDAFGQADDNQVATARGKYEAAIQQAKDFGAPNPEETKPVQEAKAAYDAARESGSNEAQVCAHVAGRSARRERDSRTPPHLHRSHARTHHQEHTEGGLVKPRVHS